MFIRTVVLTALFAVLAALLVTPAPASAQPATDDEGGTEELREKLDAATRDYNNAKGRYEASKKKADELAKKIESLKKQVDELQDQVGELAAAMYKGSRADTLTVLLESKSRQDLAQGMTTVEYLASRDNEKIKELKASRDELAEQHYELELELRKQRTALSKMEKRKKELLSALIAAGGGDPTGGPDGGAPTAEPAPRNPDGSFPPESCSRDDPTSDGCLTPRTLHAYQEAREAGFVRYTHCWRQASYGEHPKGRACDFSATPNGFVDAPATGSDKAYGDRLAGWFVANANALGVQYVIWYRRIWEPGNGWSTYNGGGSPAGDHTNHVHVSIQ